MVQTAKQTLSVKLDEEKKKYIMDTIESVSNKKQMDKGDALFTIIKAFNESNRIKEDIDYSKVRPFNCNFLNFNDEKWICLEPMGSSKKPVELGIDITDVRPKCQACFDSRAITENERKRKLLEKDNIKTLTEFYKDFTTLTRQGFDASFTMCKGSLLEKNTVIISRDGECLYCPIQNMDIVNIKEVCKEVINPITKASGCQYLTSIEAHVKFKGSKAEQKIKEIFPKLEKENEEATVLGTVVKENKGDDVE